MNPIVKIEIYRYRELKEEFKQIPSFGGDEDYVVVLEDCSDFELGAYLAEDIAFKLDVPKSPKGFNFNGKLAWVTHHA